MDFTVYYWEYQGLMTAAFKFIGMNWGLSFPLSDNAVQKRMDKKKLLRIVKDTYSVLLLHGPKILDKWLNINWKAINDLEAEHFWKDRTWIKKVKYINNLIKTKYITIKQAKDLNLI